MQNEIIVKNYFKAIFLSTLRVSNEYKNNCTCITIDKVDNIKHLDLHVDSHLKWKLYIDYVTSVMRKLFYVFRNIRNLFD